MEDYYSSIYPNSQTTIVTMYPGDTLSGHTIISESPYRVKFIDSSLQHLIKEQYSKEIENIEQKHYLPLQNANLLLEIGLLSVWPSILRTQSISLGIIFGV